MKKKIIITITVASTIIASFLLGTTQSKTTIITKEVETIPTGYINTSKVSRICISHFKSGYMIPTSKPSRGGIVSRQLQAETNCQ